MANYIKATNFTAKDALPSGNSGKIIKGTEIDVEFTAIATAIGSKADTNSPTFTGSPLAPTATAGTSNTQIATTAFVQNAVSGGVPSGVIVMWSGSIASIPSGWVLCNGSNSTPDLRDRFVIGAGSAYAVAATGGSKDAIVVSHTHTATVNDPGHSHSIKRANATDTSSGQNIPSNLANSVAFQTDTATTGISVSVNSAGSSGTNANLPPYYALAYIMKT
jgi:microcystin-dependent protein